MGALSAVVIPGVVKPEKTPEVAARLAVLQQITGGHFDRVAVVWRDGKRGEKEILLHLAGCPAKWAAWQWQSIPAESQIQIRERARAMASWLTNLVGVVRND